MFSFKGCFFTNEIWYHIVPLAPKASGFPLFQNPDILISESFSNTIVFLSLWRILHEKGSWQNWSRRMRITMRTMTLTWQTKGVREFANIISSWITFANSPAEESSFYIEMQQFSKAIFVVHKSEDDLLQNLD